MPALLGACLIVGSSCAVYAVASPALLFGSPKAPAPRILAPTITQHPAGLTESTSATFAFTASQAGVRYQCDLDGAKWVGCRSPASYRALSNGQHEFAVRALDVAGNQSPNARFAWKVVGPTKRSFTIAGGADGLLYPGASRTVALTIANPNHVVIYVTSLTVSVTGGPIGCSAATNVKLTQSSASATTPLTVPAGGSVTLPSEGVSAPTIQLLDLPVNQNACKGASFALVYSGSAHS